MKTATLAPRSKREKQTLRPVISKIMRAPVVEKFRQPLQIHEVPLPSPGPGQALLQIIATGVCHTDLHAADGDWPVRRHGTCVLVGLSPGDFPVSIFDVVLNRYTLRGSIVRTREDLHEALAFAARGKAKATIEQLSLESINDVFARVKEGKVNGRVVLTVAH